MRSERGSILLHVLVTGVLVAMIASSLLQMTMLRYQVTARANSGAQKKRSDQAALNQLISFWNAANSRCVNNLPGYSCAGAAGTCSCTCTPVSVGEPTIYVSGPNGGPCTIQIVSSAN